ncbi:MAG: hypothetical protein SH856_11840 [Flavobacteriales bacterium]|nr:hypothetical protein [Flavobacteriales bacterium]
MVLYASHFKSTEELLEALAVQQGKNKRKKFNAKKFAGKMKWHVDAVKYQKQLRGEWN